MDIHYGHFSSHQSVPGLGLSAVQRPFNHAAAPLRHWDRQWYLTDILLHSVFFISFRTAQTDSPVWVTVTIGGYIACVMAKYALHYARYHPKMQHQVDLRSAVVQFYRPVFPTKPMTMRLREVSIGKGWSTLRIESFQGDKLTTSGDLV